MSFSGLHADDAVLETGDHLAGAQLQVLAFGAAAFESFAVLQALEIDVNAVTGLRGALHGFVLGALLAQRLDHLLHVGVADLGHRLFHFHAVQRRQFHVRVHLEGGDAHQLLAGLVLGGLETGHAGGLQGFLLHRLNKGFAHHVGEDLVTHRITEATLHFPHRHLARAKAVQADAFLGLAQLGVDRRIHFFRGHTHGQTPFQT